MSLQTSLNTLNTNTVNVLTSNNKLSDEYQNIVGTHINYQNMDQLREACYNAKDTSTFIIHVLETMSKDEWYNFSANVDYLQKGCVWMWTKNHDSIVKKWIDQPNVYVVIKDFPPPANRDSSFEWKIFSYENDELSTL